jgi:adenylate cyclase
MIAYNLFILIFEVGMENRRAISHVIKRNVTIWDQILIFSIVAIMVGLLLSLTDSYIAKKELSNHSLYYLFTLRFFLYFISITVIFLFLVIYSLNTNYSHSQIKEFENEIRSSIINIYIVFFIYSMVVSILINFINEMKKKFGPGNLIPLFLGKYSKPVVEDRIFLFIDLKSSTTYAEKLGHIKYSLLIQDCFYELNKIIFHYDAEIYQYVGDEAVITWKSNSGLKDLNAILFFFRFDQMIKERKDYFISKYALLPEFKAGLHMGIVTATEVGNIKREIAYHGDAINTAARTQGLCNQYSTNFLTTGNVIEKIDLPKSFEKIYIGKVTLRGKSIPTKLYSLKINDNLNKSKN